MTAAAGGERLFTRDFLLVTAASMLTGGYAIMLLTLTLMYGNDAGFGAGQAGLLSALFAFASLGCRPFSGLLCDRFPKKRIFLLAAAGFAVCPAAFLLRAPFAVLAAARAVQGACMAAASTAAGALATERIPRGRFTEGVGVYGIGMAASAAAPGVGLRLLAGYGYPGVFLFASLAGLAMLALMLPVRPAPAETPRGGRLRDGLWEPSALFGSLCTLALTLAQVSVLQFLSYYVKARGASGVGAFYGVSAAAVIAVRLASGRLHAFAGDRSLLLAGGALLAAAYAGLFLAYPSAPVLGALAVVYGAGHSLTGMVLNSLTVSGARPERVGAANAAYLAASDLGYAFGPMLWSAWCVRMGYLGIYPLAAAAVAVLLAVFAIKVPRRKVQMKG